MPVGKKRQSNPRDISGMPTEAKLKIACYIVYDRNQVLVSGTKTKASFGISIGAEFFVPETDLSNFFHVSHFFRDMSFNKLEKKPRTSKVV